ncbi:hypothetical protein [Streptomyces griseorubiginosus]|uniref:hypothetical protein n=1 Tax=Streptomyces griseorubiginosus TaxID=67304 RepID=UPI0036E56D4B
MSEQPTPVHEDANATLDEVLARAARDLADATAARLQREQQGGTGIREGILPGGDL